MATVAGKSRTGLTWGGTATTLAVAGFLVLVGLFLSFSLGSIGRHGGKAWLYWLHIVGGSIVLLLGPFQFIASIRNQFRGYHRLAGYSYAVGSAAAFVGFWAIQPTVPDVFFLSQATAITLWMLALIAAISAARRKRMLTHQHNMTRSFVLAAYFVVVRLVDQYGLVMLEPFSSNEGARLAHSDWLAWVVPLAMVEVYYGRKWDKLLRKRVAL